MKKINIILLSLFSILLLGLNKINKVNAMEDSIGNFIFKEENIEIYKIEFLEENDEHLLKIYTSKSTYTKLNWTAGEMFRIESNVKLSIGTDNYEKEYITPIIVGILQNSGGVEIRITHFIGPNSEMDQEMIYIDKSENFIIKYLEENNVITYVINGQELNIPAINNEANGLYYPEKPGYMFDGWYLNENLTEELTFPYQIFTDMKLYPKWIEVTNPITLTIGENEYLIEKDAYIKEDYLKPINDTLTFSHWKINNDTVESLNNYAFENDVELTPMYKAAITFYDSITDRVIAKSYIEPGDTISYKPNNPTKDGFEFNGWVDINQNKIDLDTTEFHKNTNLYTDYIRIGNIFITIKNYDEIFNLEFTPDKYNKEINLYDYIDIEARLRYSFDGFYFENRLDNPVQTVTLKDDLTIMMVWTFKGNITIKLENVPSYYQDELITYGGYDYLEMLEDPVKSGHAFLGWYLDENYEVEADGLSSVDITLYAKWLESAATIYFEMNGASPISPVIAKYGQTINLPTHPPLRNGYIFTGWYLDKNLTQEINRDDVFTATTSTTIYAGWEIDENYVPEDTEENEIEILTIVIYALIAVVGVGIVGGMLFPKKGR